MTTGKYLVAQPQRFRISELLSSLLFPWVSRSDASECPDSVRVEVKRNWKIKLLMLLVKSAAVPLAVLGVCIEFILNLRHQLGGFLTLRRLLPAKSIGKFETFLSFVGLVEHRVNLYDGEAHDWGFTTDRLISVGCNIGSTIEAGNSIYADLCIMASTAAYENELVIRNRVTENWKMHFVEFFDCWNDYLKNNSTEAFIFCDNEEDARLIVLAFRGTEPFDANDWLTDIDISMYETGERGKVHFGFLEALGLANRLKKAQLFDKRRSSELWRDDKEDPDKPLAYITICKRLKKLLQDHKNAKFIVTGHSLGGALAVLFSAILFMDKEETVLERLLAVYTFGQPRVGDEVFAKFMNKHLNNPVSRYFRIVYCNDVVPRLPYDDGTLLYHHFGVCLYYNSCYHQKTLPVEPDRNFSLLYFVPIRINAVWELVQSLILHHEKGRDFKETKLSILFRIVGLMLPGVSAHSPVNYINAVRLGPCTLQIVFWDFNRKIPNSGVLKL